MSTAATRGAPPRDTGATLWRERRLAAIVAFAAFLSASYMALYQWGLIDAVWDPVFGAQSAHVLDSEVSRSIRRAVGAPDAAFGALAYLGEIVLALAGSTRRWSRRPWLVGLFGLNAIALGITGALLVGLQGVVVGSWCFLCLFTAATSLVLVWLAHGEIQASLAFLRQVRHRSGRWRVAWDAFMGRSSAAALRAGHESMGGGGA